MFVHDFRRCAGVSRRTCLALLAATLACGGRAQGSSPSSSAAPGGRLLSAAGPSLQGSFIQLHGSHLAWRRSDWERLFRYFDQLQLQRLIIQWSANDGVDFSRPADAAPGHGSAAGASPATEAGESVVGTILDLASARGMPVLVGLDAQSHYWQVLSADPAGVAPFLRQAEARSLALASHLVAALRGNTAFAGWYLSEEIDDETWAGNGMQQVLIDHLRRLRRALNALNPTLPVAISGFTNGRNPPSAVAAFWGSVLAGSEIDLLLMQDSIGTHKLQLAQLGPYLAEISAVVTQQQRTFWVVTELFEQVGGPPIDNGRFRAKPAPLDRIQQQLRAAAPYASALIGFSVPEYMTPLGDLDAGRLLTRYRQQVLGVR
jgi:hypothetical protein